MATILHDLLKAFDRVACQKLIDAAVRTCLPVRPLKLLQLYQAPRRVELDSVAGDALEAQLGIIPGCAFATTLLQLLLVGPLREVRSQPSYSASLSTISRCSVLATTTGSHMSSSSRALAWQASSRRQGAKLPPRSPRSSATQLLCGRSCSCGLLLSACRQRGQNGTSELSSRQGSEHPRSCSGRGWRKFKRRVKGIRKIHSRSSVPLRQRLARIAHAPVSEVNHRGVAVTGLNETQLQQSQSQVATCLAKRLRGKSVTMVLMTPSMSWTLFSTPWRP